MTERVFVTGLGLIAAIGNTVKECLVALKNKQDGLGELTHIESQLSGIHPVCEIKASNAELAELAGTPKDKVLSRTLLLGLIAAREAAAMANLSSSELKNCGVVSANTVGGMDRSELFYPEFLKDPGSGQLFNVVGHECGYSTEFIAEALDLKGTATTISTACSSSANSVMLGARFIKHGMLDSVIVGGCDSLAKFTLNGFGSLKILSKEGCRPFDETRTGLNLGEGAGFLVLESESQVKSRNTQPICEVTGFANTCDAYHQTASSPDGDGSYQAMKDALEMAALNPEQISYINAHGTGTQNNDLSEGKAIQRLFNAPLFSSTKPYTGHTLGAAGGIEAVLSCLSLQHQIIYPNLRWKNAMTDLSITPITEFVENQPVNHVLTNSFGFGGNDTSLIFSKV